MFGYTKRGQKSLTRSSRQSKDAKQSSSRRHDSRKSFIVPPPEETELPSYQPGSSRVPIVPLPYEETDEETDEETEQSCATVAEHGQHIVTMIGPGVYQPCCEETKQGLIEEARERARTSPDECKEAKEKGRKRFEKAIARKRLEENRERSLSPGGTEYERVSTYGERCEEAKHQGLRSKDKKYQQIASGGYPNRRTAYGFDNPSHDNPNVRKLFTDATVSPPPPQLDLYSREGWVQHLGKDNRSYQAEIGTEEDGTVETGIVKGHKNTVMGHHHGASAGQSWNRGGHKLPRGENLKNNRNPSAYHGLEEKKASARSGHKEVGYIDPSPSKASHRSYYDIDDPDFQGGFGNYYQKVSSSERSHHRHRADDRSVSPKTKTRHTRERSSYKSRSRRKLEIVDPRE